MDADDRPSFGMLLRQYRSAAGLSQEELAGRAGLTAKAIGALERGERRQPQPHTVRQLATALGLSAAARAAFSAAVPRPSLAAPPPTPAYTVPAPVTPLVGREREVADVRRILAAARLVTLTGAGGVGKTRLALQVAAESRDAFPGGALFVDLAPLTDPRLVPLSIEHALGAAPAHGTTPLERMVRFLGGQRVLLVLDNLEQVLEAAPVIAALLSGAPGLRVLATSRVLLHLYGEHEYRVPPLSLPSESTEIERSEAVRLFVQAAQAARPDFVLTAANRATVAAICAQLDGLPLALELGAARLRLFTLEALRAQLANRLEVLSGRRRDLPARQQTLRQTFDWSYALLAPAERGLLAALGVFAGGFTPRAVAAVCAGQGATAAADVLAGLESLHESGLVERERVPERGLGEREDGPGEELRFRLLETVREYALARLAERGDGAAVRRRHAAYYVALAEQARRELTGARQREWIGRLEAEHANVRAVLEWCQAHPEEAERGLRLVGALGLFWFVRGHWAEGQTWIDAAFAWVGERGSPAARARALWSAGAIAWRQGDLERAHASTAGSLALCEAIGDTTGSAASHIVLGLTALARGDVPGARAHEERALALSGEAGGRWEHATALVCLGHVLSAQGERAAAGAVLGRGLQESRALGDERGIALALLRLGELALRSADYATGRARLEDAAGRFTALRDMPGLASALMGLGVALWCSDGDAARAQACLSEALTWWQALGNPERAATTVRLLGQVALDAGQVQQAAVLFTDSVRLADAHGHRPPAVAALAGLAGVACAEGRHVAAARLCGIVEASHDRAGGGMPRLPFEQASYDTTVATLRALPDRDRAGLETAWADGRAAALEAAIQEILDGSDIRA